MGTTTAFGIEHPDQDADLDTWGDIETAYKNSLEAKLAYRTTGTVSAAATADIPLPLGRRNHRVTLSQVIQATDNQAIAARLSFDGGSTFKAGASDYAYVLSTVDTGLGAATVTGSLGTTAIFLGTGLSNGAARANEFVFTICGTDGETVETSLLGKGVYLKSGGALVMSDFGGTIDAGYGDADYLRIVANSGNISLRYTVESF